MSDKMMARIQAMLAKAESTDSVEEAHAFAAKAAELMLKHGIDEALLRRGDEREEEIVSQYLFVPNPDGLAKTGGMAKVLYALGGVVQLLVNGGGDLREGDWVGGNRAPQRGRFAILYGGRTDLDMAVVLLASLLVQQNQAITAWWAAERGHPRYKEEYTDYSWARGRHTRKVNPPSRAKRSYVDGWWAGAAGKIGAASDTVLSEASEEGALVLVERRQRVTEYVQGEATGRTSRRGGGDGRGRSSGAADGRRADFGTGHVGGGRRALT